MAKTIEESAADFEASNERAQKASQQLDAFANGGPTQEVVTDSGNIPTLAKFLTDKSAEVDAAMLDFQDTVTGALADDTGAGLVGYKAENAYTPGTVGRALNVAKLLHEMNGYTDRGPWATGTEYWDGEFYTFFDTVYFVDVPHVSTTVENDLATGRTSIRRDIPILAVVPLTNRGPIFVSGIGLMEWDGTLGLYVAKAGGAKGGGADQIFYENGRTITTSYDIPAGKNAMTTGPVTAADGVVVSGGDDSIWTVI